jgi:hypothetical protein
MRNVLIVWQLKSRKQREIIIIFLHVLVISIHFATTRMSNRQEYHRFVFVMLLCCVESSFRAHTTLVEIKQLIAWRSILYYCHIEEHREECVCVEFMILLQL